MYSKEEIAKIFRYSASADELFDAFKESLELQLKDIELYKIFLSNPANTADEIKMYMEKLIKEFPQDSYALFMWAGQMFESFRSDYERLEDSYKYYFRAFETDKTNAQPILKIISLYSFEIDFPLNKKIIETAENNIASLHQKSVVYFALSNLFGKIGNVELEIKYYALAEKAAEREN
jgi:hypothetical protein